MARYLLTCECGKSVPVEPGQAGGHVACSCGKRLDVPTLRHLRQLSPESAQQSTASRAKWSTRRGLVVALLVPAAALGLIALYMRSTEPTPPKVDFKAEHKRILGEIDQLSPAQWYEEWTYRYRPATEPGFAVYQNQLNPILQLQVRHKRMIQNVLLSIAAALTAIALLLAIWPAPKPIQRTPDHKKRN